MGHLLLLLGMLGSIAAGLWEGGAIQATMQDGITAEREARVASEHAQQDRMTGLNGRLDGMQQDIRELRNVTMEWLSTKQRGR